MTGILQRDAIASDPAAGAPASDADRILTWRWPWLYEGLFCLSPASRRVRALEIDAVLARIDAVRGSAGTVIEVGCGPGTYTRHLAARFAHVTALDASRGMVDHTKARMRREGHRNVVGAYGRLPDDLRMAECADGVVAVGVLDFTSDLAGWLRAMRSCVLPGGWLVFTVPSARTAPRAAGAVEGLLAGRVFTRRIDEVHEAIAAAGLVDARIGMVEHRGRAYTMVGSAIAP